MIEKLLPAIIKTTGAVVLGIGAAALGMNAKDEYDKAYSSKEEKRKRRKNKKTIKINTDGYLFFYSIKYIYILY